MPSLPTYGAPLPDQPPPPGRFGSPQRTLLGCGGMATVFLLLLLVVAACSETTPAKPLPAPTVTATVTVTAQPTPALRAMPQIVGSTYADAAKQIEVLGGGSLQRRSVYTDVVLPADTGAWLVCIQGPAPGEGITNGGQRVALAAPDATCPEGEGLDSTRSPDRPPLRPRHRPPRPRRGTARGRPPGAVAAAARPPEAAARAEARAAEAQAAAEAGAASSSASPALLSAPARRRRTAARRSASWAGTATHAGDTGTSPMPGWNDGFSPGSWCARARSTGCPRSVP